MRRADVVQLLAGIRDDPQPLLERLAWIDTKQLPGQPARTRLVFNRAQQTVHAALLAQAAAGMPKRGIVLKARQPGISTQACGYCAATALRPHAGAMIISHREDLSAALHRKTKAILTGFTPTLPIKFGVARRDELVLDAIRCDDGDLALHSTVQCATAGVGSAEGGRGVTLQWVHLSEYAAFPNAAQTLVATLQAVPPTPQSGVVIESTARGMGNSFHHEWLRAEEGASGFTPIFIGWPLIEEYQLPIPHDGDADFAPDELELLGQYQLTPEQIWWRRYVINTQCAGQVEFFNQEYPLTPAEAFIVSGLPAFPRAVLIPMHQAMLAESGQRYEGEWSTATHVPTRLRGGRLRIYRDPVASHEYTIGADPSGGQEGGDPAAACVFDRHSGEVVCVWHGHLAPIPFAQVLDGLGRFYNEAIVAPELNSGHGFSVVEELKTRQYPRIYVWQRVDKVTHAVTNFYGWSTSYRTRPLLIDNLRHGLAESEILVRDPAMILELLEFQYIEGRAEGLTHDDLAIACMIAFRVHIEYPMLATGLPPRHVPETYAERSPPPSYPNTYTRDAWEGVDRDLQRIQHGKGSSWADYAIGKPSAVDGRDLTVEPWDDSLDEMPEWPW